eukprot:11000380-Prorocentrum_lima.AAC.1
MEEGSFLCWDPKAVQGAYIASVRPNGNVSIVVASAPTPWPHDDVKGTSRTIRRSRMQSRDFGSAIKGES